MVIAYWLTTHITLPVIVELHKSESVFDDDITEAAVGLEELLNVALASRRGDIAEEHACAGRHLQAFIGEIFASRLKGRQMADSTFSPLFPEFVYL